AAVFALLNPQYLEKETPKPQKITLSEIAQDIEQGKIKALNLEGNKIKVIFQDQSEGISVKEANTPLIETLKGLGASEEALKNINLSVNEESEGIFAYLLPLSLILPVLFFLLFFGMIFRQVKTGAGQTFNFLKTPAKLFGDGKDEKKAEKTTFADIAGIEEAKEEIQEVVDFLKNPKKYLKMGARIPRGVLLVGAPGTGKTMLAKAVANEAKVPFFSMVGSEFIELFVGVGASRTRALFAEAKKKQPSIIFIDEIDSIGKTRGVGFGGGHDEREQTLNQILAEMDGFERDAGVIVFAATNRPEYLDPALLRPGRFDRRIVLDLPDAKGRAEILKIHLKDKPLSTEINLTEVAERTPGFSGADLANLANEAAILAAKKDQETISQLNLLNSIEKVLLGPERKSHLLTKKEKEISAFHEAGHALLSSVLENAEEVRKVSIVSRGMAAGYTLALPKEEKKIKTKSEFKDELCVLLAGYLAEKIIFNEISTGASNDLEKASILARNLVVKYGMSKLGPIVFGKRETMPFLNWDEETTERNYSEKIASEIDQETANFIQEAEKRTTLLLKQKIQTLRRIAQALIEKETLEKDEFEHLLTQEKKPKPPTKQGKKPSQRKMRKKSKKD
ncbi:ATP-dependent zinc metalloprotease FtsH, partial [Candidatus Gribaldobacteria bacterium]|nr:ATP-dependent zinc metalloprotease FtsH [Candidatus Gribaldobacteria bacterium]